MLNKTSSYSSPRKGFILFVVLGILSILALLFYSIHQRSGQRNLEAHRHFFHEASRTLSQSGVELLSGAFREGIKTPPDFKLDNLLHQTNLHQDSFYGLFLLDIPKLNASLNKYAENDLKRILDHDELLSRFPQEYQTMLDNLLIHYPGSSLNFSLVMENSTLHIKQSLQDPEEEKHSYQDYVEKSVILEFCATATYRHTNKSTCIEKKFKVYNLYNPILNRFTFFHKTPIGSYYNNYIPDTSGRPSIENKMAPLILTNGPLGNSEVPDDQQLLGALGDNKTPSELDGLTNPESIKKSRDSIYRRGYLFFGMGEENAIKMSHGFTRSSDLEDENYSAGQFFHLYNPAIVNTYLEVEDGGAMSPQINPFKKPDFFSKDVPLISTHLQAPLEREQFARPLLYNTYIGHYLPPNRGYQEYVPEADKFASLIHPFGSDFNPSRAKTIGPANFHVVKIVRYLLDGNADSTDEDDLRACSPDDIYQQDAYLGVIPESTASRYLTHLTIPSTPSAIHRNLVDCDASQNFVLGAEWTIASVFPTFEEYEKYMSGVIKIPMNETLDYPHFSHTIIPPDGHSDYNGPMFPNQYQGLKAGEEIDPEFPPSIEELVEIWPLPASNIRSKDSYYVNGLVHEFTNADFVRQAIYNHIFTAPF
ncbi:hypothetical protein MJH12_14655, partial [bacterium]|nr:hypothetical protein [bacterium]